MTGRKPRAARRRARTSPRRTSGQRIDGKSIRRAGKGSGGRAGSLANLKKGGPGRPRGSRDKVPRGFKKTVAALYRTLMDDKPRLFQTAIERGLKASPPRSYQYLQLGAYYLDGKPTEKHEVSGPDGKPLAAGAGVLAFPILAAGPRSSSPRDKEGW